MKYLELIILLLSQKKQLIKIRLINRQWNNKWSEWEFLNISAKNLSSGKEYSCECAFINYAVSICCIKFTVIQ